MTEHTAFQLRRGLRAALAATAVASIAFVGVACTQTGSGQDDPNTPTSSSDTAGADAAGADTKGTDTKGADTAGSSSGSSSGTPTEKSTTTSPGGKEVLDKELGGQEAIDALGDDIDYVAKLAGKSVDELKDLLLRDKSAHVTTKGRIVYRD